MTIRKTLSLLLLFIATHALAQQEFSLASVLLLQTATKCQQLYKT